MYCVLRDCNTKTFYMKPREVCFFAYSDPSYFKDVFEPSARLVETEYDNLKALTTELFNAGFLFGYLDGEKIQLKRSDSYFYDQNCNEIAYAQYLLTKDERYLSIIKKNKLLTICQIKDGNILFPTIKIPGEEMEAVLTFTSKSRIPAKIFERYPGYKIVYMSYKTPCIINGSFVVD